MNSAGRPVGGGLVIGWREWVTLPDLGITVKAKVDTGARTSAIHATDIVVEGGEVEFTVHPHQRDDDDPVRVRLPVLEVREIRPSSGEAVERHVVKTWAKLGRRRWQIELTLASRHDMGFRMLLGRTAVRGRFLVDPAASYLAGGAPD
jgi:hypothetical protein